MADGMTPETQARIFAAMSVEDDAESARLMAELSRELGLDDASAPQPVRAAAPISDVDISRVTSGDVTDRPTYTDIDDLGADSIKPVAVTLPDAESTPTPPADGDDYPDPEDDDGAADDAGAEEWTPGDVPEAAAWESGVTATPSDARGDRRGARYDDDDDDDDGPSLFGRARTRASGTGSAAMTGLAGRLTGASGKSKLTAALVAAVLGVGVFTSTVGNKSSAPEPISDVPEVVESASAPAPEGKPVAATEVLTPSKVSAICPPPVLDPSLAFDPKRNSAWVCQIIHGMAGTMEVWFARPVEIKEIALVPGWPKSEDNGRSHWLEHMLITKIMWGFPNEVAQDIPDPTPRGSVLNLRNAAGQGVVTSHVVMKIQKIVSPAEVIRRDPTAAAKSGVIPNTANGLNLETDLPEPEKSTAITGLEFRGNVAGA